MNIVHKQVCVIGAGPCGLTAAKNLLREGIQDFVVFEKNTQIGGNWVFDENNDHASVYETTHLISSKKLSEFEDFPMPASYPDYPSHRQLFDYFNAYADHFRLKPFIRFKTTVEAVVLTDNHQWCVTYKDEYGQHQMLFDYILVANGHHWDPFMPASAEKFTGQVLHSHDYKKAAPFRDQRVLVVGGGNSACDIAVEISRISPKTWISMRSAQHIFPKFIFGKPTDIAFSQIKWMPYVWQQWLAAATIRLVQGRYKKYQLKTPTHGPLEAHPTINSELLYFIRHGKIEVCDAIERCDGNQIYFMDGRNECFDTLIFATGYHVSFPFFDKSWFHFDLKESIPLYLRMIHEKYSSLFFIGLFQPLGCIWPLADHQARIAAKIIQGDLKRPNDLKSKIIKENQYTRSRFKKSTRHALEVDYHLFRKQLLTFLDGF